MKGITPNFWFDNTAEEAVNFYTSVFPNSKIKSVSRYGEEAAKVSGQAAGTVMSISFELDGQDFMAINGGPIFKFTEAISFMVSCETQEEIDHFWEKLSAVPESEQCGWLKDKYGVSWQIVPSMLGELMGGQDAAKSQRVMKVLLQMKKLDIEGLKQAAET